MIAAVFPPVLLYLFWSGLASTASVPRSDDGVVLFNEKNGWESAFDQMARGTGGGGGAMMWSGWGPRGMTAFTSTGGGGGQGGGELAPPPGNDPDQERSPRADLPQPPNQPANGNGAQNSPADRSYNNHQHPGHSAGSSNANASFNAWFPIVLGMFPGGGLGGQGSGQGSGGGHGGSWGGSPPVAAVANSISHGAHGVASSHAVAYGGQPQQYRPQQPHAGGYYGGSPPEPHSNGNNGNSNHAQK